ncbi:MAG: hypothetical protein COW24_01660 [Candidatus Kerfeldbacteria bacterium CG15_BIG_FIL_POST_REV_8_21_14_020_45_12]|uniref:Uncharacterized protein n=1 Tax=Candidatus Kerfeldbacteria bacterium CG15_BIG_FIL_POST_REV_8_21_14_020_45_12 TaxID=2014247 RepID=A0A2M7H4I9_9BACT|nr:MAG: hypothetical protein COW24_01660 [Candidatus Kerfeldbacteria bacterium CG15_BIG_FIL_POST_REV_8_21_14_020_45_12]PJA92927.1 MAG: hypothetical protein CO132_05460 [Candidatus Kerfeldbacteria bacterium CG_4_9_14_3_um_filter_45_8]
MSTEDHTTTEAAEQQQSAGNTGKNVYGRALALVGITTGYIFGPMVLFGGIGWLLGKMFDSRVIVVVSFLLALVVSNVLIFRNTEKHARNL